MKIPLIIYNDIESLLEKIDTCQSYPESSSTTKINKYIASDYSSFMHCSFDARKNKHTYYRGNNCMKNLCKDLKKHRKETINYEKEEIININK